MNEYAQSMRDMLSRVGQPRTSTTTIEQPKQKLDIGSLMMMLMMSNMLGKKPDVSSPENIMNPMEILGPMGAEGGFGGAMSAVPDAGGGAMTAGGNLTPELLFKLLLGFGGR